MAAVDAMNRLAEAAEKVARLEPRLRDARAELHAAILDAHRQGVEPTLIARIARLSRQRVAQIVEKGGGE